MRIVGCIRHVGRVNFGLTAGRPNKLVVLVAYSIEFYFVVDVIGVCAALRIWPRDRGR